MTENPYDILGVSRDASADEVKRAYRKKARENHPDLNPDDPAAADRMNKINEAYDRITNPEKYAKEDARKRGYGAPYAPGYNGYGSPYGGAGASGGTSSGSRGTGAGAGSSHGGSPYGSPYGGNPGQSEYVWVSWEDLFGGMGGASPWSQAAGAGSSVIHPEASASDSAEIRQAIAFINAGNATAALGVLNNVTSHNRNARWYYLSAIANNAAGNTVTALENIRRARRIDPSNADYLHAEQAFTQRARTYEQESTTRGFSTGVIDPCSIGCCLCFGPALCQPFMFCL